MGWDRSMANSLSKCRIVHLLGIIFYLQYYRHQIRGLTESLLAAYAICRGGGGGVVTDSTQMGRLLPPLEIITSSSPFRGDTDGSVLILMYVHVYTLGVMYMQCH
jgi:hypothetical protein